MGHSVTYWPIGSRRLVAVSVAVKQTGHVRAWIEMQPGTGWGDIRLMRSALRDLGYVNAELRGTGNVLLRLSASVLERGEVLRVPGRG